MRHQTRSLEWDLCLGVFLLLVFLGCLAAVMGSGVQGLDESWNAAML